MEPFLGEPCAVEEARTVLLPVPYEKTTTYRKGTAGGPAALLEASTQVETFDEETRREPRAFTAPPEVCDEMPDVLAARLLETVGGHMDAGRRVGCLGGEHSISLGPIRAAADRFGDSDGLGILQVDAHPDLRDEYEGTKFGHGCVMRRALDHDGVGALVPVGLRAVSEEDDAVIASDARIHPFYAYELVGDWIERVVAQLPDKVYISFDLDGLDPSLLPGTGTPEPGGLMWWDTMRLLRAVAEQREVVGFDVVELIPESVSNFVAAKLVFKLLAYLR